MSEFFQDHSVLFALVCSAIGIAFGIGLTVWLLRLPAGNARMQEIAHAVQEGASAYLRRQYLTIAVVAAVLFVGIGLWADLGWGTAFGFLIGAVFSAAASADHAASLHRSQGERKDRRAGPQAAVSATLQARPDRALLLAQSQERQDHEPGQAAGGSSRPRNEGQRRRQPRPSPLAD